MNMMSTILDQLQTWFETYTNGFYEVDAPLNAKIEYKQQHSVRTRQEMHFLAERLGWSPRSIELAEAIGLLHDVGRFEQLKRHQTYNDHQSLDHALLGVEILEQEDVLRDFTDQEQIWIKTSIRYHNARLLPSRLDDDTRPLAQLIRDADKLDIFRHCAGMVRRYLDDPEGFALEVGFPLDPYCTPEVVAVTLKGESVDYRKLQTFYDCLIMQLGWVYDLNFPLSMLTLKTRGHLDELCTILPDWPVMHAVKDAIKAYVDEQIQTTAIA